MKKIMFFIMVFSLLFSCKKELTDDLISEEITSAEITKDYLTFKSSDEFFSVLDSLNKLPVDQIMWYKSEEGFVSLFTIQENYYECLDLVTDEISYNNLLTEYCDVFSLDDPLQFKVYCKTVYPVINREGIVKIGNSLYKFTEDGQIILKNDDLDRLLSLSVSDIESDDVTIFRYKDYMNSKDDCGYYQSRINIENYDGDRRASLWSYIDFI